MTDNNGFNHNQQTIASGRAAVITGAANGIGLAAARQFAGLGMKLCLVDNDGAALERSGAEVAALMPGGKGDLRLVEAEVANFEDVIRVKETAYEAFGEVALLMNNAGIGEGHMKPWDGPERWRRVIDVNFWGVVHGVGAFTPDMIAQGTPCSIVNVGSKEGITTPPGNAAYSVSKAGVKVLTEQLAHELRQTEGNRVAAHLLVPGWTFTSIGSTGDATDAKPEKPDGAWTPEQVISFMLRGMEKGDFYILCPDGQVTRETDERRIRWAADDLVENRPALSRWHPDYKDAFASFMEGAAKP